MMYCSLCYCKVSFSNWGLNIFGGNEHVRKKICTHQGCNKRNTNNTLNKQLCVENIHLKVCEENLSEGRSLELWGLLKWFAIFQKCYNLFRCFVHTVVCWVGWYKCACASWVGHSNSIAIVHHRQATMKTVMLFSCLERHNSVFKRQTICTKENKKCLVFFQESLAFWEIRQSQSVVVQEI